MCFFEPFQTVLWKRSNISLRYCQAEAEMLKGKCVSNAKRKEFLR